MSGLNPMSVYQDPMPPEWELPEHILAKFPPRKFLFTPEEHALRERILANRWFLIRNDNGGRCSRCGRHHEYITSFCIDWPHNPYSELHLTRTVPVVDEGGLGGLRVRVEEVTIEAIKAGEPVPIRRADAEKLLARIAQQARQEDVRRRILAKLNG